MPWLREIEQFSVVDRNSLQKRMKEVVKAGGEGLMLHRADAPYETGRSDTLLKMKPWEDAEADGDRPSARQGQVRRRAGRVARAHTTTAASSRWAPASATSSAVIPPPVGTTVTYRYRDLTGNGLPRFASFLATKNGVTRSHS